MRLKIKENGTWDLCGEYVSIRDCAPCLNGIRISALSTDVTNEQITYHLSGNAVISICFGDPEEGITSLSCRMTGTGGVNDLSFTGSVEVPGGEPFKVFVQGFGMEGPSGYYEQGSRIPSSDGLISLYSQDGGFYAYATDHTRFIMRSKVIREESLFGERYLLSTGFDLEGIAFDELTLPALFFTQKPGRCTEAALSDIAQRIAGKMNARRPKKPAFHWCSWYYRYQNMSQRTLEEYLKGFAGTGADFSVIQLDAGYCPSLGDWLIPGERFPDGLARAAETIRRSGALPGIWIGPFMVGDESRLYKEHPDWILRDRCGSPVTMLTSYNEPKCWGSPDCNYYVLDASHPGALAYLKQVFETLYGYGFRLFKTDFMLWNMHDTSEVDRYNKSMTSVEILRSVLKVIREAIGEESYLLGCIAPFLPFIGYADGMRIAGDVGAQWEGAYGPGNMLRELTADNYFNLIYWQNDPDCVLLRDFDIHLKPGEILSLALLQALSGGVVSTSDPVHEIGSDRRKLLELIRPDKCVKPRIPHADETQDLIILLHDLPQGKILFVLNKSDIRQTFACRLGEFFEQDAWYVYQDTHLSSGGENNGISNGELLQEVWMDVLPPHESILLFLADRPFTKAPQNLWKWEP